MMIEAALWYAGMGYPVFPCQPGNTGCSGGDCRCKTPLTEHGCLEATTDEDTIRAWWDRTPHANIGIATGAPGIDVLDVDRHGGDGFVSFRVVCAAGLTRGYRAVVRTPAGGAHLWFTGTTQRNGSIRRRNLDFRSKGGYVLAPPSEVHGKPYEFIERANGTGTLDWAAVKAILDPPRPRPPAVPGNPTALVNYLSRVGVGSRNENAYWAFCRAVAEGTGLEPLIAAARMTGLPEREIRATAASAMRKAA